MRRASQPHETSFSIRTFHTDSFGHVNNAKYLELLEEARWQYAEDNGLLKLLERDNLGFIIIDMRLRFREEVTEGDRVTVGTQLLTLGSGSGEVEQLVRKEGQSRIALKSLFHFILVDREARTPVPIEGDIRELLLDVIATKS
jgi:thioesterase-3